MSHLTDKTGDGNHGTASKEAFNHQVSSSIINLVADQSLVKLDFKGRIESPSQQMRHDDSVSEVR